MRKVNPKSFEEAVELTKLKWYKILDKMLMRKVEHYEDYYEPLSCGLCQWQGAIYPTFPKLLDLICDNCVLDAKTIFNDPCEALQEGCISMDYWCEAGVGSTTGEEERDNAIAMVWAVLLFMEGINVEENQKIDHNPRIGSIVVIKTDASDTFVIHNFILGSLGIILDINKPNFKGRIYYDITGSTDCSPDGVGQFCYSKDFEVIDHIEN